MKHKLKAKEESAREKQRKQELFLYFSARAQSFREYRKIYEKEKYEYNSLTVSKISHIISKYG